MRGFCESLSLDGRSVTLDVRPDSDEFWLLAFADDCGGFDARLSKVVSKARAFIIVVAYMASLALLSYPAWRRALE